MEARRRRTDRLSAPGTLPQDPLARARIACDELAAAGLEVAFALQLLDEPERGMLCAATGRVEHLLGAGRSLAAHVASSGRAVITMEADDERTGERWHLAAVPGGEVAGTPVIVIVADRRLTQREAQAIATWLAPADASPALSAGPCAPLARSLAVEFNADTVVFSLFAQAGMLLNLHVRSGALLRSWRCPVDTVWGEAARHGAAFVLGDLHMHPGAESLASLGMYSAAMVGVENGSGVGLGSVGIASVRELDVNVAQRLLERAPVLGPQLMSLRSRTAVPAPNAAGEIELRGFAARVGCRRFALYSRAGNVLRLVAAHTGDGSALVSPPDPHEEQIVCWAAENGVAVSSDDAAAVVVGGDTVLYAQDPSKRPIECLRLALQDLRRNPFTATGDAGQEAA